MKKMHTIRPRLLVVGLALVGAACQAGPQPAPITQKASPSAAQIAEQQAGQSAAFLEILRGTAKDRRKLKAAKVLGKMAAGGNRAALDGLIEVLNDAEAGFNRTFAAIGLEQSKRAEAVEPLIKILQDETLPAALRKEAALALGSIGDLRAAQPLLQAVDDPTSPEVRYAAATALWAQPFQKQVPQTPVLVKILKDREQPPFQRARAARFLSLVGDSTAVEPLIDLILQEPPSKEKATERKLLSAQFYTGMMNQERNVRAKMAIALGELGDERAIPPLLRLLPGATDDPYFVKSTQKALTKIEGRVGLSPFLTAMRDHDAAIRREAVAAIGRFGKPEVEGLLTEALKDEDQAVREAAAAALAERRAPSPPPAASEEETKHETAPKQE